ncbi:stage II sporulation protein M [Methanoregula sp.]|uniref:stage II sporulation protein M n=1 Tax=Methanoregula sp. TaxID=2052170 RepID=UPI003BB9B0BD
MKEEISLIWSGKILNVNLFEKFLSFFYVQQSFWKYLFYVILLFSIFILLNFLFQAIPFQSIDFGNNVSFNKTAALVDMYHDYVQNQIPDIKNTFLKIFLNNFTSGFSMLILPIFIFVVFFVIGIKFQDQKESFVLSASIISKMIIIFYFMFTFIANTFSKLYYIFIFPRSVFLVSYIHGLIEIPAMILSVTFSLLLIDSAYAIFIHSNIAEAKIQIKIFVKDFIIYITILAILFAIAAFIETQITPYLVQATFEDYFRHL